MTNDGNRAARPHADYGARLARLRETAGLSQSELARMLGVQPGAINHIEAGRVLPRADRLRSLASALGVGPDQVVP